MMRLTGWWERMRKLDPPEPEPAPNPARALSGRVREIAGTVQVIADRREEGVLHELAEDLWSIAHALDVPDAAADTNPTLLATAARDWENIARAAIEGQTEARRALRSTFARLGEVRAPAQRDASVAIGIVTEALRGTRLAATLGEVADAVLSALAGEGLLTPGDVVVRDARAMGLGVLVDGRPVEPERVLLVSPADDPVPSARCGACGHVVALADVSPVAPCPSCGEDRLVAIVPVRSAVPADGERRDPVPDDLTALVNANPRLDGGPAEARAAVAALRAVLGEETEPHMCTCGHVPEKGVVGCSDGFMDRCRFELAIRQVLGR